MKFNCPKIIPKDIYQWNPWFAWYPVRVRDGSCRWLETVHRKAIPKTYVNYDDWQTYEYISKD